MPFVAWMGLAAATLFLFAAIKGYSPLETLRAVLRNEALPKKAKYAIAADTDSSKPKILAPGPIGGISYGGTLQKPVDGTITSPYGQRWGVLHAGVDIAAGTGTPIRAAGGGTIERAGWNGGYGNYVRIAHGNGLTTAYGHLSDIAVTSGQNVSAGQTIGYVGSTGDSTGPHLHFEVRVNGVAKNPLDYIGGTVSV